MSGTGKVKFLDGSMDGWNRQNVLDGSYYHLSVAFLGHLAIKTIDGFDRGLLRA
jgi:hypothetical protein